MTTMAGSQARQNTEYDSGDEFAETLEDILSAASSDVDAATEFHESRQSPSIPPSRKSACTTQRACTRDEAMIDSEYFGHVPQELFVHILKYLAPDDLASVAKVCKFLKRESEEDNLWRRGYCLRWGPPKLRVRGSSWKKLYFERDQLDMNNFLHNCPEDFRESFIQMQATKRSQAPKPNQVSDELVMVESATAKAITSWRSDRKLPEVYVGSHECSGLSCTFQRIENVFLCDETGKAHVCDEGCTEMSQDPENELLVCTISGRCIDRLLYPHEEVDREVCVTSYPPALSDAITLSVQVLPTVMLQAALGHTGDDPEVFLGAGRFGRAYSIGYSCDDEKELRALWRTM